MNRSTEPLALRARCLIDEGAGADADASVMMNDGLPRAGNFAMTVLSDMTCRRNSGVAKSHREATFYHFVCTYYITC
jgi:hypothetical protein